MGNTTLVRILGTIAAGVVAVLACGARTREASYTVIVREDIEGHVLYEDGHSPVYRAPVRLWDIDRRRFVYQTATDRNGFFAIPVEEQGNYYLVFDWTRIKFKAVEPEGGRQIQSTHVVTILPRPVGYVSTPYLVNLLAASSMTEVVRRFDQRRPRIISP